jgi:hypothetical protein
MKLEPVVWLERHWVMKNAPGQDATSGIENYEASGKAGATIVTDRLTGESFYVSGNVISGEWVSGKYEAPESRYAAFRRSSNNEYSFN